MTAPQVACGMERPSALRGHNLCASPACCAHMLDSFGQRRLAGHTRDPPHAFYAAHILWFTQHRTARQERLGDPWRWLPDGTMSARSLTDGLRGWAIVALHSPPPCWLQAECPRYPRHTAW